jgi:hypothetical protein
VIRGWRKTIECDWGLPMPHIGTRWTLVLSRALGLSACLAIAAAGAASQSTASQSKRSTAKPLTLVGCIGEPDAKGEPTFSAGKRKRTYRLTGQDLREYAGKRVEIVGSETKHLQVVGGLTPSPNVAGQAGAIDPSKAAIAGSPGGGPTSGTGDVQLPEFRVSSIRTLGGSCTE